MKAKYDFIQTYDGEWNTPPTRVYYRACCDCGLVHKEQYRLKGGKLQYRVWRDKDETQKERRRTGKGKKRK